MEVSEGEWSQKDKEVFLDKRSLLNRLSDTQSAATATSRNLNAVRQSITDYEKHLFTLQDRMASLHDRLPALPAVRTYEELLELESIPFKETPGNDLMAKNAFKKTVDRDKMCQEMYEFYVQREYEYTEYPGQGAIREVCLIIS